MAKYTESDLEQATMEWLEELGYQIIGGPDIAPLDQNLPDLPASTNVSAQARRVSYLDVVLVERLKIAIAKFNPEISDEAKEEALRKVLRVSTLSPQLVVNNKAFHSMLRDGIDIEYKRPDLPASRPGLFFIYAILCDNDSIYIGQTENIERRWNEHIKGMASDHTKKFKPKILIHYEEFNSREKAVAREKWLKTGFGRKWLKREWEAGRTRQAGGSIAGDKVKIVDIANPDKNDFLAVNQFTVIDLPASGAGKTQRRPDVVIFINGLPVAVIELKNPADVGVTIGGAFNQIQTYINEIPTLFAFNELSIVSDGMEARVGTISSSIEWFTRWRTVDGEELAPNSLPQLEVLLKGIFEKKRLLDIINNFVVYETDGEKITKKLAAYHQYHATNKAVKKTIEATKTKGDRRCGVVWHTQGSGKSLTMVFYAGKIIQDLNNPTIVVLTDRNDLDDQLFGTFSRCSNLLRQTPKQAENREQLKEYLKVASGGVVFTTIQKFFPENGKREYPLLSDRKNIVVIADEAHRSQYDFIDGFARYMRDALPNASFIGFTGTPIELTDKNTRAVFGDYVDIYDVSQSVEDKATVPIYYEARLAKIAINENERPKIDPQFEELTEGEEVERKEKLKSKWARLEALVGAPKRIALIARDVVDHFENRLSAIDGKGMIVAMSRRIAVEIYNEIIKLRPNWASDDDNRGFLKIVMTGSAMDPFDWQKHIRTKQARHDMANRMKDPGDELKLVIVRDMWLTGFDVPSLHTMYIDKPMKGHGLMQTIARVNRVFKDKRGGLIVDYLGIAPELKDALAYYADNDRKKVAIPQEEAVKIMLEKYEVVCGMYHGFDYKKDLHGSASDRTRLIASAMDFALGLEDGEKRYIQAVTELSFAFSLSVPHEEALRIRDEVAFFQSVKAGIRKTGGGGGGGGGGGPTDEEYQEAIKQIISGAIVSDKVIDIYSATGIKTPDISILSDEFLAEVKGLPHKNLAFEMLKRLLNDEIVTMMRSNLVKSRSFAEMLEETIKKYQNRTIEAAQVIAELVDLAKKIKAEKDRGKNIGLSPEEVAFYDALCINESAIRELGDETLMQIARELVSMLRKNTTIDWTIKENVQAKLRVYVKKLLRKYNYPPDKQGSATQTVLEQASLLCKDWSGDN